MGIHIRISRENIKAYELGVGHEILSNEGLPATKNGRKVENIDVRERQNIKKR